MAGGVGPVDVCGIGGAFFGCSGWFRRLFGCSQIEVFRDKNIPGPVANGFGPYRVHSTTDKTAQQRDGPADVDHALFSEFGQEPEADSLVDFNKGASGNPPERRHGHLLADFYARFPEYGSGCIPAKTGKAQRLYAVIIEVVACQGGL